MESIEKKILKKVVIIGAGPAGLTAAYELLKDLNNNYEVIILEETNELGGISKTINHNGNRMDIGGHRFFSRNDEILKFWKNLMPLQGEDSIDYKKLGIKKDLLPGGPNPEKNDEVMLIRNRVSRIYCFGKFFDYPITLKKETFTNLGFIKTGKVGLSYLKSVFIKKKEKSLEDFYINRFGKMLYSMFFEKYTEKVWGRTPSKISVDWGKQRVKGISIKSILVDMFSKKIGKKKEKVETSLIEEFWYPKLGPGQLWEKLAKEIENSGGKILKSHKVEKITIKNGKITSVECKVDGKIEVIRGDIFISSMPIKNLVLGFRGEEIPKTIIDIAKGLPYRDFITVGILVNKLKIQNKTKIKTLSNIIPDNWIYVQEPNVKMGRIQIFNNWSPYLVKDVEETVWMGLEYFVNENDEYWNMSEDEFTKFAIDELIKMGIIEKDIDILDTHVEKVKKAYPAYFDTYSNMEQLIEYLNKYENLYCIGRNGQHRYNNMDHSMLTAIEAVKNIKENKLSKNNIWKVNTEKEYHEIRKNK